jgi:glutamyl-tRNA synthetase
MRLDGFENITLLNYLLSIGSSLNLSKEIKIETLLNTFDISNISTSSPKFSIEILKILNKDILQKYDFLDIKDKILDLGIENINIDFWKFVKNNIDFLKDCLDWKSIITSINSSSNIDDNFLNKAAELLPTEPFDHNSWDEWTSLIKEKTGKKGKDLFMPLRVALTGKEKGPELKYLMPLLSKDLILRKFGINT